jgi:hypothetical protein
VTTPEERRLAELLQGEAELLEPGGSALDAIRSGVRRRRARRRTALSASALGLAVVVGASVALAGGGTTSSLEPAPQASSSASATPSPSAVPSADPDGSTTSVPGTPFFPFTSDEQAADWAAAPGDKAWASDPVQVAQRLVDDLLQLEGVEAGPTSENGFSPLTVGGALVARVQLAQLGTAPERPWVALRVLSADEGRLLEVTSPLPGNTVTGVVRAAGTVVGVDESVRLQLRSAAGELLAEESVMAGSERPWSASLAYTSTSWSLGVLTAMTSSAKDGSVARLVAVPVLRDASPTREVPGPTEAFVGEVDGVVGLYDATDGERLLQVSFPPAGYTDVAPRRAGTKVLWLRLGRECSDRKVIQRDLATDVTATLVADQPLVPVLAASPDGRWTAWALRPGCESGETTVVVQGPDGTREIGFGDGGEVSDLDLNDDGALLAEYAGEDGGSMAFVPPGSRSIAESGFDAEEGCLLFNPAFLDEQVVATEVCDPFDGTTPLRVVTMSVTGERLSETVTQLDSLPRVATADGQVLTQRFEPSGAIGRLVDGRFEAILEQPACRETLEAKGCLTSVDW